MKTMTMMTMQTMSGLLNGGSTSMNNATMSLVANQLPRPFATFRLSCNKNNQVASPPEITFPIPDSSPVIDANIHNLFGSLDAVVVNDNDLSFSLLQCQDLGDGYTINSTAWMDLKTDNEYLDDVLLNATFLPLLETTQSNADWIDSLKETDEKEDRGFALELWFVPPEAPEGTEDVSIFTIGRSSMDHGDDGENDDDISGEEPCGAYDYRIRQVGSELRIDWKYQADTWIQRDPNRGDIAWERHHSHYCLQNFQASRVVDGGDNSNNWESATWIPYQLTPGELTQLIVSHSPTTDDGTSQGSFSMFVNGQALFEHWPTGKGSLDTTLQHFNEMYRLQFWPSSSYESSSGNTNQDDIDRTHFAERFRGGYNTLNLYDHDLDASMAQEAYFAGLADIMGRVAVKPHANWFAIEDNTLNTAPMEIEIPPLPSGERATIGMEIQSVPRYGRLFLAASRSSSTYEPIGRELREGDVVSSFDGKLRFLYQCDVSNYFNIPETTASGAAIPDLQQEYFIFRMVAVARDTNDHGTETTARDRIMASSLSTRQEIYVLNANDRGEVKAYNVSVEAIHNPFTHLRERLRDFLVDATIAYHDDVDRNVDMVRVALWTENDSRIRWDHDHIKALEESGGGYATKFCRIYHDFRSTWQCGDNDFDRLAQARRVNLLLEPQYVSLALSNLTIRSVHYNESDVLHVYVYDGNSDHHNCPSREEHALEGNYSHPFAHPASEASGCFLSQVRIPIPSSESVYEHEMATSSLGTRARKAALQSIGSVFSIFLVAGFCVVPYGIVRTICCCCRDDYKGKDADFKGAELDTDSEDDDDDADDDTKRYNSLFLSTYRASRSWWKAAAAVQEEIERKNALHKDTKGAVALESSNVLPLSVLDDDDGDDDSTGMSEIILNDDDDQMMMHHVKEIASNQRRRKSRDDRLNSMV